MIIKSILYRFIHYYINNFISKLPFCGLRKLLYRTVGLKVGKTSYIASKVSFISPWKVSIGNYCCINQNCLIDGRMGIQINDNVDISNGVKLFTLQHDPKSDCHACVGGEIVINKNTWIATDAIILPGVEIGRNVTIACCSVVTKNVPPSRIYAGIPAKDVGESSAVKKIFPSNDVIRLN